MGLLPRLALRGLLRQRRRTLLALAVLVAGFVSLALAGGFAAQTFQALADSAIRGGLGHVQILKAGSFDDVQDKTLEGALASGETLAASLRRDPAVADVLPRISFMGLLSSGAQSVAFLGTAVDPIREPRFMAIEDSVRGGAKVPDGAGSRWLSPDPSAQECLAGIGLARSLGAKVGSVLTIMATTRDGALNALDVEVVGLQDLGVKELNDRSLVVSLATASKLLDAGDARSRLSIVLKRPSELSTVLPRLAAIVGPNAIALPWTEAATFYQQVRMLYLAIFGFMGLVLAFVVLLATTNVLLMGVMERIRDFGVLRALGLRPGQLLRLLQWEGLWMGLAGSVTGLAATLALRAFLNALHIQMPAPPGSSHGYELHIQLVPGVYLAVILLLQFVIQLAALLPGLKAARIRITEALRHL